MRRTVLGLLLWFAPPAGAADFYVDPVNGSDAGDGSAANPWRTLQAVIEANLIETRNWESLPYHPGLELVPINVGAPVKAGDTLWLRSGYHGAVVIQSAYNAPRLDVERVYRPQGGGFDLGAYERCRGMGPGIPRPCGRPGLTPSLDLEGVPAP